MIEYYNRSGVELPDMLYVLIDKAVTITLEVEGCKNNGVSVSFVTESEIHQLNEKFRRIDRPTDVLSFPSGESRGFLGDVIISVETARKQAAELNHSLEREICFLAVHSALHLIGYDHLTPEDEQIMIEKQESTLSKAGLARRL